MKIEDGLNEAGKYYLGLGRGARIVGANKQGLISWKKRRAEVTLSGVIIVLSWALMLLRLLYLAGVTYGQHLTR